jgi:hypothetical protein
VLAGVQRHCHTLQFVIDDDERDPAIGRGVDIELAGPGQGVIGHGCDQSSFPGFVFEAKNDENRR